MGKAELVLIYIDGIPEAYFADVAKDLAEAGVEFRLEPRPNEPYAALEWVVPTAIAIYIGKPFIDVLLKRAADDVADKLYPAIKNAIKKLVQNVLVRDKQEFGVVSTSPNKVQSPESLIFSIYAETRTTTRLKFIFDHNIPTPECQNCVNSIFAMIAEHHASTDNSDRISEQIANLGDRQHRQVYLIYDSAAKQWNAVDLAGKLKQVHQQQDGHQP